MAKEIADAEAAWISAREQIIVISSVLKDSLNRSLRQRAYAPPVTIIPNGIHLERYRAADGRRIRTEWELQKKKLTGLVSGLGTFSGVIRYLKAVRLLSDASLAHLIVGGGPLLKEGQRFAQRERIQNVTFTGQVDSRSIADYFSALDVGVIPFDLSDFTHAACPIKLLEYLACGKPVVSTPLREIIHMRLPGVIFAGPDPESFAQGISQALVMPRPPAAALQPYDLPRLVDKYESILLGRSMQSAKGKNI
jgi:glycosyltransferase involved in cell wall biosynthesis